MPTTLALRTFNLIFETFALSFTYSNQLDVAVSQTIPVIPHIQLTSASLNNRVLCKLYYKVKFFPYSQHVFQPLLFSQQKWLSA